MGKVLLQCFLLLITPILGTFFRLQDALYAVLAILSIEISPIEAILSSLPLSERGVSLVCGFLISSILLWVLRKVNKEKVFNTGDKYGEYPLFLYYFASKILGYGFVTLVRVPIHLQFQLVIKDLFDNVKVDDNTRAYVQPVKVMKKNMEHISNEVNLVLNDTYKILEEQIPPNKRHLPTIIIFNGNKFSGVRNFNTKFVDEIRKQTNKYSQNYSQINIFATTNTKHNKAFIEECFKNARRTGFKNLTVFQFDPINNSFAKNYSILKS